MDYNVLFETGSGRKSGKLASTQMVSERDKRDKSLASLKRGQQITGTVVSVDKQVTLNFGGQKLVASKEVLKNTVVGEMKTFEVMKTEGDKIELRLLDGTAGTSSKTFIAAMMKETDWDSILAQKEQNAKKAEKEKEAQEREKKLEEISAKLTEQDYGQLEEEGFPAETLTIDGLYSAIKRVKTSASQNEQKTIEKMNSFGENEITARLKAENLPVTTENLGKIGKALELSETAMKLDDKAMRYLISQEAEPTIENIYKAYYSGNTGKQDQSREISSKAWGELEVQVKDVIGAAGYEINNENLNDAKWLLENNLPLTEDTFTYKKELDEIKNTSDKDMVFNKIIEGMKNGIAPKDVSLAVQEGTSGEQLIMDINSIEEKTISHAVRQNAELTIKRLLTLQEGLASTKGTGDIESGVAEADTAKFSDAEIAEIEKAKSESSAAAIQEEEAIAQATEDKVASDSEKLITSEKNYRYEEIKAQRQLEEIRLKMTLEAAAKLEKKGISIETQRLEKIVEALRELEDSYSKEMLKEAEAEITELSLRTLKETTQSLEQLKYTPSYVLGSTLEVLEFQTISGLLSEGRKQQMELAKAGTAYETLMTRPNSEYGDSIRTAFTNMSSLLSELDIANTEQNQRAARILGYNQMEITQEQINRVKAYDLEVTTMMENLQPAVTVRMIKDGMNPLTMPINELNQTIDRIKEEQGISSEEKFSTYLHKLEKENGITQEERKAYIGIYRLLYNVEKSDGAALGAVIKAEREVTLEHLLTAVQTSKKGRLDAVVDDEFGTLQSISREKETIAQQLSSFHEGEEKQSEEQSAKDKTGEQVEYLNRILKQMKEEIAPDKLQEVGQNLSNTGTQAEQSKLGAAPLFSSDRGIWETVKDVPVEKLYEQLRATKTLQAAESEAYAGKVQEIRDLCKNSEAGIRFLNDYQVASTPANLMMANHILNNGETPLKRLLKKQNENIVENSEKGLMEIRELSDTLIDKSSMNEAYEKLEVTAKEALNKGYSEEKIDNQKLAELKSLGQQMTFLRTLAEKEFYQIPIETEGGITNMNLTILRGTETSGKVSVTVWSEQLGSIKADFSVKEQTLKGFISCDNRNGLERLQESAVAMEASAQESGITLKQLDFGLQRKENDSYSYQYPENEAQKTSTANSTERVLYRVAKAIVQTVRMAEHNELEQTK